MGKNQDSNQNGNLEEGICVPKNFVDDVFQSLYEFEP